MGCDIHAYVEYKKKDENRWQSYSGEIQLGRAYDIFGILGQVRGGNDKFVCDGRGCPDDLGYDSSDGVSLYVVPDDHGSDYDDRSVSRSSAEQWIKSGESVWMGFGERRITNPDWHSHSWCNATELEECLNGGHIEFNNIQCIDYSSTLFLMKFIESMGHESRLVYWFDS